MRLYSIRLENFKGIKQAEYLFKGQQAALFGDNATGKTTVYDAFTWVLFGRPSTDIKNFSPKTMTTEGEAHNLDHIAEVTLMHDDGSMVALKRVFKEVYTRRRGIAIPDQFKGHTTEFYIDGVPTSDKDFAAVVAELCGNAEQQKILTMYDYFPNIMHWEKRREALLVLCGDVADDEIFSANKDLQSLKQMLLIDGSADHYHTVEDFRAILAKQKKEASDKLKKLPVRIDEAERAKPTVGRTLDEINVDRENLIEQRTQAKNDLDAMINPVTAAPAELGELQRRLNDATAKQDEAKQAYVAANDHSKEIADYEAEATAIRAELTVLGGQLNADGNQLNKMKQERQKLIDEFTALNALAYDDKATCPTCGQPIAQEVFEADRQQRLAAINERGKATCSKEAIAELSREMEEGRKRFAELNKEMEAATAEADRLRHQQDMAIPWRETQECATLQANINEILEDLQGGKQRAARANIIKEQEQLIATLTDGIAAAEKELADHERIAQQDKRIAELKAEEKQLAAEFEDICHKEDLCDKFVITKITMLDDKINAPFSRVQFRLFRKLISGGVEEACDVLIRGENDELVAWQLANRAGQINGGLEIIDILGKHFGIRLPVFVDNAEAVTQLYPIETQIIRLIVSEQDKKLRLELEG